MRRRGHGTPWVYQDNVASPPETYTASDNNSVMEVAFTVEESAIPECPAIIAGIVVGGMCFGIYCWMRKRNPGYVRT